SLQGDAGDARDGRRARHAHGDRRSAAARGQELRADRPGSPETGRDAHRLPAGSAVSEARNHCYSMETCTNLLSNHPGRMPMLKSRAMWAVVFLAAAN